jgi:hypothetical protein|tara:strand:- start:2 stop:214 length:213 start_codon:yes stop_codon:yes gene_type:complete
MKSIKFKGKDTLFIDGVEYKGYKVGELPASFGFKEKYLGQDEEGNDQYKYGKSHWLKFRSLTWLEKPPTW